MTSRIAMKFHPVLLAISSLAVGLCAAEPVVFQARTSQSGKWSDAQTWAGGRQPQAGDFVQVRAGHVVTYDVASPAALRMLHVAGKLTFSRGSLHLA